MRSPEEWPSRRSNPEDKIRLTGPAAIIILGILETVTQCHVSGTPLQDQRRPKDIYALLYSFPIHAARVSWVTGAIFFVTLCGSMTNLFGEPASNAR
jgi:hypothetical protein